MLSGPLSPGSVLIVRLPPEVKELTFRLVRSRAKSPVVVVGANPAIKLSEAGVQVGVNGRAPCWLVVVIVNCAGAEPASVNKAARTIPAGMLDLSGGGIFMMMRNDDFELRLLKVAR